MTRSPARAIAASRPDKHLSRIWALIFGVVIAGAMTITDLKADGHEKIITSHGFSNYGALKYGPDFEHLGYVNPEAPKGGEIAISARGTFDSMNPYSRKGRGGTLSTLPYERLMADVDDDAYGSYCVVCTHLEYPESQDWVIFHMNPDAKFSDGSPVTSKDLVFTIELFLEQGLPSYREAVKKLYKSVEALDDHTVKFTFGDDVPRKGLIGQAGASIIFQQKWFEETGAKLDESRLTQPLGSGPYIVDTVEPGRRIIYKRNPDYWGANLPIMKGRNNYDTIRVEYFADDTAALEGFKSGVYTFRQETSSLQWATAYDFPKIDSGVVVKEEIANGLLPPATGFVFNLRRDKFADKRVRQALSLMYNFQWTNETLQYGLFAQRSSFWENTDLGAEGAPQGDELEILTSLGDKIDPAILTEPVIMAHESSSRQLDRRNLRKALGLMEAAGYVTGDDGLLRKDGQPLEIEFLSSNPSFDRIILPYIENLKRLGVDADYNRVDPAQYTNLERDFQWDMIYDGYRNGLEENLGISQRFGCEDAEYSLFNPSGYCSEAVDELIERLKTVETLEGMKTLIAAIDRIMRFEQFIVPVWYNDNFWVAYYDMYEYPENLPPYNLGHLDFWWVNADKAAALKSQGAF